MVTYVKNPKDSKIKTLKLINLFSKGEGCEVASRDAIYWYLVVEARDADKHPYCIGQCQQQRMICLVQNINSAEAEKHCE